MLKNYFYSDLTKLKGKKWISTEELSANPTGLYSKSVLYVNPSWAETKKFGFSIGENRIFVTKLCILECFLFMKRQNEFVKPRIKMVLLASEWPDLVLEVIFSYLDSASLRYENICNNCNIRPEWNTFSVHKNFKYNA